jgi:hypothetical protein
MVHNKETIDFIIKSKAAGYSSREIASILGIGKSTVNDIYNRHSGRTPKIALLDLETAAAVSYHFSRWNINVTENHVKTEGGNILVGCYKWLGEDNTYFLNQSPKEIKTLDDSRIVATLYDLYEQADAVVMHNGKKFDHKVLQTRGLYHNYGKLPTVKIIDTLEIAKKKLRFPSNRLDSIANYLGLGRKLDTGGIDLWKQVQEGDKEAMEKMKDYCIQDVNLLESVFMRMAHLGIDGYNAALYFNDDERRCNVCGGVHVEPTGRYSYTSVSAFSEYECLDCGAISRDRKSTVSKDKRSKLLT